jgi:lipoate-protein ligase B
MSITSKVPTKSVGTPFFIKPPKLRTPKLRPTTAYHLAFREPISWTHARDTQNAIIKGYQNRHHTNDSRALPPTFITLRFNPVFTYGRNKDERPSLQERKLLEGLPDGGGVSAETRMAWSRQSGWRFHGPAQIHCWMVADLRDWEA